MKQVLLLLANGFELIEATTAIDVLGRAGNKITIAACKTNGLKVESGHRPVTIIADCLVEAVDFTKFDLIVLPGGQPGVKHLSETPAVLTGIKQAAARKILIGAICAAPQILGQLGLLTNQQVTSYPGATEYLDQAHYIDDQAVVISDNFITSASPGTALKWSLTLVSVLNGKTVTEELKQALVIR